VSPVVVVRGGPGANLLPDEPDAARGAALADALLSFDALQLVVERQLLPGFDVPVTNQIVVENQSPSFSKHRYEYMPKAETSTIVRYNLLFMDALIVSA
jgi:hypothetical protein